MAKRAAAMPLTIEHESSDEIRADDAPCTALALAARRDPVALFAEGAVASLIDQIKKEIRSLPRDITTPEGRAFIKSTAYQLSRRKVWFDKLGLKLTEDERRKIERVNAERKTWREEIDALQEEFRQPLTDFEEKDAKRVADHAAAVDAIDRLLVFDNAEPAIDLLEQRLAQLETIIDRDWEEFQQKASFIAAEARDKLNAQLAAARRRKADAEELEQLRAAQRERERVAAHETALAGIIESSDYGQTETAAELGLRLKYLRNPAPRAWEEFAPRAMAAYAAEIARTEALLATAEARELAARQEHDRQVAAAAAQAAADAAAAQIAEANAAAQRAQQAQAAAEKARNEAHEVAKRKMAELSGYDLDGPAPTAGGVSAKIERLKAIYDRDWQDHAPEAGRVFNETSERLQEQLAAAQAREKEAADAAARQQQADEQKRQAEALAAQKAKADADAKAAAEKAAADAEARENNLRHAKRINNEALADLVAAGLSEAAGKAAIAAIAKRAIRHITISY